MPKNNLQHHLSLAFCGKLLMFGGAGYTCDAACQSYPGFSLTIMLGGHYKVMFAAVRECWNLTSRLTAATETYVSELERFNFARKSDSVTALDYRFRSTVNYDFGAISKNGYSVDPNLGLYRRTVEYLFFMMRLSWSTCEIKLRFTRLLQLVLEG